MGQQAPAPGTALPMVLPVTGLRVSLVTGVPCGTAPALLWLLPDLLAGARQPLVFELLRLPVIVLIVVVSVLLFRARHDGVRRRLPLQLAVTSLIVLQSAIAVAFNSKAIVAIVAWGLLAWMEARRALQETPVMAE